MQTVRNRRKVGVRLVKSVCQECVRRRHMPWSDLDDSYWKRRSIVDCPDAEGAMASIYDTPPERCPYYLCHAMARSVWHVK